MSNSFHYQCNFGKTSGKGCDFTYVSLVELSDYPWCPSDTHHKKCDFIESESTGVPKHVDKTDRKRKLGGNWL